MTDNGEKEWIETLQPDYAGKQITTMAGQAADAGSDSSPASGSAPGLRVGDTVSIRMRGGRREYAMPFNVTRVMGERCELVSADLMHAFTAWTATIEAAIERDKRLAVETGEKEPNEKLCRGEG